MTKLNWYLTQRKNDTIFYFKKLIKDTKFLFNKKIKNI